MQTAALRNHLVNGGRVECDDLHYRLVIPSIGADAYTDAQLDDYDHSLPRRFINRPPQHLRIHARFSHAQLKGTAGFGFWNHPFSRDGDVLAPPSNVWFFYSSPESDLRLARGTPGHGFKATVLTGGTMPGFIVRMAGLSLRAARRFTPLMRLLMYAGRTAVQTHETQLRLDMTQWHDYEIEWLDQNAVLGVDGTQVLRAPRPPHMELGFAAWVDNYQAVAHGGDYQFAYVASPQDQWLEMEIMNVDD